MSLLQVIFDPFAYETNSPHQRLDLYLFANVPETSEANRGEQFTKLFLDKNALFNDNK